MRERNIPKVLLCVCLLSEITLSLLASDADNGFHVQSDESHEYPDEDDESKDMRTGKRFNWKDYMDFYAEGFRPLLWNDDCYGYELPWERCTRQCFTKRHLILLKDAGCRGDVRNETLYVKICTGEDCPLSREHGTMFLIGVREAMFRFQFENNVVKDLTEFLTALQLPGHLILMITICVVASVRRLRFKWLPDVDVAVPVAAGFALFARFAAFKGVNFSPVMTKSFGCAISSMMNQALLPITIFTGAYDVQRKNLYAEFPSALFFALVGTGSQIYLVARMVFHTGQLGWHCVANWRESFAYASFIADVDPVITLSIFANLKVPALLQTLAAGEGLLNDPIALVIFGLLNKPRKNIDLDMLGNCFLILKELVLSILTGSVIGLLLTKGMSLFHVTGKGTLESIYVVSSAYVSYSFGERIGMSGIIVCLFCGLVMGIFVESMVDDHVGIKRYLHTLSHYAEILMFFIVGFGVFLLDHWEDFRLGVLTIFMCIIARGITIAALVSILNIARPYFKKKRIDFGTAFMLFHSNLRGGITLMMALELNSDWSMHQDHILGSTIVSMIGLNYIGGFTAPYFMSKMKPGGDAAISSHSQTDGELFDDDSGMARVLRKSKAFIKSTFLRRTASEKPEKIEADGLEMAMINQSSETETT